MARPGILVVDRVDFNNPSVFHKVLNRLHDVAARSDRHFPLWISKTYYFTAEKTLPSRPGWYLLLSSSVPIYAGQAEDLNVRLNSENGSRDQFANPQRNSDPARNFIKTFVRLGLLNNLEACIFLEEDICDALGISAPLSNLDRDNVEKFLNLMKGDLRVPA